MLITSIHYSLNELIDLLGQLSQKEYSNSCTELSDATIGEHTRHIIEMFQCLENQYNLGVVNYDKRERNTLIQTDTTFAIENIRAVQKNLEKENKNITLLQIIDGEEIRIESNYNRELLYNLEHCIHHQALIKVAILQCETVTIDPNFGVARSTIEYRNQCVQ
ncbi:MULTISPECIES: DinB family protein [unclassified Flavobacterium]|uniref:DinB family protein n=1 Tax=unclassified Flavobacterium TaxID=196869 RepID=UPI00131E431D|nr:DinB family protein [Flavobacterium sp. I-STPP5a]